VHLFYHGAGRALGCWSFRRGRGGRGRVVVIGEGGEGMVEVMMGGFANVK
jgi:hypothetical protein